MTDISRWARPDPDDASDKQAPGPDSTRQVKAETSGTQETEAQQTEVQETEAQQIETQPELMDRPVQAALKRTTPSFEDCEADSTDTEEKTGEAGGTAFEKAGAAYLSETESKQVDLLALPDSEVLSPTAQYILQMRNCLFLFWLPLAANAGGCFGGKYLLQSARLQAIVTILTLISPVTCLVVTIILDKKVMRMPASIALAGLLIAAMAIGGLSGAFELVGTWTMLTSDKDPNMKQLNSEVVNATTNLVLYDYNPPMKRTMRILRSEAVVFPGLIFAKKQQEKSD